MLRKFLLKWGAEVFYKPILNDEDDINEEFSDKSNFDLLLYFLTVLGFTVGALYSIGYLIVHFIRLI